MRREPGDADKVAAVLEQRQPAPAAAPQIEMLGAAEPREAAAVIAAVEQFLADTAPAPAPAPSGNPVAARRAARGRQLEEPSSDPPAPDGGDRWQ